MYLTGRSKVWWKYSTGVTACFQEGRVAQARKDRTGGRHGNSLPLHEELCEGG